MAKPKDSPGQATWDFSERGAQLRIIRNAVLPKCGGVSVDRVKHVLETIDSHARGGTAWLAYQTIARETQLNVRLVRRAVKALEGLMLLNVHRRRIPTAEPNRATCNHYTISWGNLIELVEEQYRVAKSGVSSGHLKATKETPFNRPIEPPPPGRRWRRR